MRLNKKLSGTRGAHVLRGTLMGAADIVPGVSGGTVALVLGIYERLVTAISHFDLRLIRLLRQRHWRRAALHVDLPMLIPLGVGILIGFIIMTTLMNYLLRDSGTRTLTLAMFFGLILASGFLVAAMVEDKTRLQRMRSILIGGAGALSALWLTGLETSRDADPHLMYLFACGAVAICAMILPGISGAMILLILGVYMHLTEIPRNILHGQDVATGLLQAGVFASGCVLGLLTFSKLLRWLLAHYHAPTLAVLCGFMFGSLRKLWPFQQDVTPWIEKVKYKTFRPIMPRAIDQQVIEVIVIVFVAAACVIAIDRISRKRRGKRPEVYSDPIDPIAE